jgi:hypothetical protein
VVVCDWCTAEQEVERDHENEEASFSNPLPDESWFHLEGGGEEQDFCSKECLLSSL